MTTMKIENDGDERLASIPMNTKKTDSLQLFDCIIESRNSIKSASENSIIKVNLLQNKNNPHEINNIKQTTQEISSVIDVCPLKSNVTSMSSNASFEKMNVLNEEASKSLIPNVSNSSEIYVSCRFCKKGFETLKK